MSELTTEQKQSLVNEISELEKTLTGDMFQDMDVRNKIHNIKMKIEGVRPPESFVECVGCGS